jgi:hypothetical protein
VMQRRLAQSHPCLAVAALSWQGEPMTKRSCSIIDFVAGRLLHASCGRAARNSENFIGWAGAR